MDGLCQATRVRRNVIEERQYGVFATTPFTPAVSTGKPHCDLVTHTINQTTYVYIHICDQI